jgi:hypothetical protein
MVYIYVLKLENEKYYVGKTMNPSFRMESHFNENGSAWTKKYKPIKLEALIPDCDDYDEDKYTRKYMDKYGVENVRGGSFISIDLDENTLNCLTQMSNGTNDKCFKCGMKGHFAKNCKEKIEYEYVEVWCCDFCHKEFNTKQKCNLHEKSCNKNNEKCNCPSSYFSPHRKNKCFLRNMDIIEDEDDNKDNSNISCFKCGRSGHYATNCYAKTDINGKYLKKY